MKKIIVMIVMLFCANAYAQEPVKDAPVGNKGYIFGAPPKEEAGNKECEASDKHSLPEIHLIKGIKKVDDWLARNLW